MSDQSIIRITKELSEIQKNSDLSLAVACRDVDVRNVKAMIIGPPDTPYEFGFFEFAFTFGKDYPRKSPVVTALTTNGGRCRFNPNIYASGKVCLSILGTWRGEPGEEWSAAQGLESILLSIQSLMSSNPYENEPGFEEAKEPKDKKNQQDYVQKIRHETLRIAVIQRMEEYLGIGPDGSSSARGGRSARLPPGAPAQAQAPTAAAAASVAAMTPPPSGGGGGVLGHFGPFSSLGSLGSHDSHQHPLPGDEDMDLEGLDEASVPFEPFKDLIKRRFLWYYDSYLAAVQKGKEEVAAAAAAAAASAAAAAAAEAKKGTGKSGAAAAAAATTTGATPTTPADGTAFARMPFEGSSNTMDGRFHYGELERRLRAIKAALDAETAGWAAQGRAAVAQDATVAVNLQRQFEQAVEALRRNNDMPHSLELEEAGNPFVWVVTYFGKPMTNLDGGLFRFRVLLSPRFPEEQPRARFDTPLFHHRITAADGTPCYTVAANRREDVKAHIEAIIEALEEENPAYDPRTLVHAEAHKLYWGSPEDRKLYNRKLRRSVQQSLE